MIALDPLIAFTVRCCLALLLCAASLHKTLDPRRVRTAIEAFGIVPSFAVRAVSWLVIGIESVTGLALLVPAFGQPAAAAAGGVFGAYFCVMALSLLRGAAHVDCGCSFHGKAGRLSGAHLTRTLALIVFAIAAAMPVSARALGGLEVAQIGAAVTCFALLYLSVDSLLTRTEAEFGLEAAV